MVNSKNITTIKIEKETKSRLDKLKEHERETYNQIIKKILHILNIFRKNPDAANNILRNIDRNIKRKPEYTKIIKKSKIKLKPGSNLEQNPQQDKGSH